MVVGGVGTGAPETDGAVRRGQNRQMPIGISEDHEALRAVVARFVEAQSPPALARAHLDSERDELPPFWNGLADVGWLGLHVGEAFGGAGFGLLEQCVVVEELGRGAVPGPYVLSALAAAVVDLAAANAPAAAKTLLPSLSSGELVGT